MDKQLKLCKEWDFSRAVEAGGQCVVQEVQQKGGRHSDDRVVN